MNGRFFRFDTWAVSDKGCVRDINEDQYLAEPLLGVWAVADGMGGHDAGEVASSAIVEHLGTIGIASSAPDLRTTSAQAASPHFASGMPMTAASAICGQSASTFSSSAG